MTTRRARRAFYDKSQLLRQTAVGLMDDHHACVRSEKLEIRDFPRKLFSGTRNMPTKKKSKRHATVLVRFRFNHELNIHGR